MNTLYLSSAAARASAPVLKLCLRMKPPFAPTGTMRTFFTIWVSIRPRISVR